VQSRDAAEVAFWVLSYLLQLRLFRSIRRFAIAPPGSPESNRACGSAVSLALFLLVLHSWKVLKTNADLLRNGVSTPPYPTAVRADRGQVESAVASLISMRQKLPFQFSVGLRESDCI
jgi:hypothetical protein